MLFDFAKRAFVWAPCFRTRLPSGSKPSSAAPGTAHAGDGAMKSSNVNGLQNHQNHPLFLLKLNLLRGENVEKGCMKKCVSPTLAGRASIVLKDPRSACFTSSPSELSYGPRAFGHDYPQGRSPPQLRPEPPTRALAPCNPAT